MLIFKEIPTFASEKIDLNPVIEVTTLLNNVPIDKVLIDEKNDILIREGYTMGFVYLKCKR